MELLVKQLAIQLSNQKTVAKLLVIVIPLSRQTTATNWLVMLRCGRNFLLTYDPYAALRSGVSRQFAQRMLANFFRALLTIPHGLLLPVADRRPLVGHFGEL
jgi:hypothetical protein